MLPNTGYMPAMRALTGPYACPVSLGNNVQFVGGTTVDASAQAGYHDASNPCVGNCASCGMSLPPGTSR